MDGVEYAYRKKQEEGEGLKHLSVLQLNFMCWREFSVAFGN